MANHKSAKKRILRNESKSKINSSRINRVRTFIKKIEKEIDNKDSEKANSIFKETMPEIHRSVSKGLLHKKTAARKLSRLSKKIKSI
mgnify:FL=1|tara:strand:- start:1296 stop:1556 length:261 start_codon:yes stop_codon:yes gene_type:complete